MSVALVSLVEGLGFWWLLAIALRAIEKEWSAAADFVEGLIWAGGSTTTTKATTGSDSFDVEYFFQR